MYVLQAGRASVTASPPCTLVPAYARRTVGWPLSPPRTCPPTHRPAWPLQPLHIEEVAAEDAILSPRRRARDRRTVGTVKKNETL